jgi:hypothetical protein
MSTKPIFVKPSFVEKKEGERIIHFFDANDIEFIDSHINNGTMGFYMDTLEKFFEIKKENVVIENVVCLKEETKDISLSMNKLKSYFNEHLSNEKEKEEDIVKLREIIKRWEHPKPSSFKELCCNLFNVNVVSYPCEYCNVNSYPTVKSLSAHQRKCKLQYTKAQSMAEAAAMVEPDPTLVETEPIVVEVPPQVMVETVEKPVVVSAKQKLLKKAL